CMQNTKDPTF
nr:immunoglobulin light chain junction region [Macaca mulatta]